MSAAKLEDWFAKMPVVAILRGVKPDEVVDIGHAIYRAGIGIIEIPLNSPDPFDSIERLQQALGEQCVVGAGTVVDRDSVDDVARSGGKIVVTPNVNVEVITRAIELDMIPMPGWATPSEAFAAYQAGARYLKLFPAATYGAGHVRAVRAVLPPDARLIAVGGVGPSNAGEWLQSGLDGLGIASDLYRPGDAAAEIGERAEKIVQSVSAALPTG